MAVDFENSQTKKNLEAAFAGESQATNKYAYYASKATRPPATRRSTPSSGSSTSTAARCPTP